MPFIESDLHLTVVICVPDHLTGDSGAHGGQFHVVRHSGDLGEADGIRYAIEQKEDAERLSADDSSADLRSSGSAETVAGQLRSTASGAGTWERSGQLNSGIGQSWLNRRGLSTAGLETPDRSGAGPTRSPTVVVAWRAVCWGVHLGSSKVDRQRESASWSPLTGRERN